MDPIANLTEQRSLARAFVDHPFPPAEDVARLGELVLALDEWRSHGGFDPYAACQHFASLPHTTPPDPAPDPPSARHDFFHRAPPFDPSDTGS